MYETLYLPRKGLFFFFFFTDFKKPYATVHVWSETRRNEYYHNCCISVATCWVIACSHWKQHHFWYCITTLLLFNTYTSRLFYFPSPNSLGMRLVKLVTTLCSCSSKVIKEWGYVKHYNAIFVMSSACYSTLVSFLSIHGLLTHEHITTYSGSLPSFMMTNWVYVLTRTTPNSLSPFSIFSLNSFVHQPLLISSASTPMPVCPSHATSVWSTLLPPTTLTSYSR